MATKLEELYAEQDTVLATMTELTEMDLDTFSGDPENQVKYDAAAARNKEIDAEIVATKKAQDDHDARRVALAAAQNNITRPQNAGGRTVSGIGSNNTPGRITNVKLAIEDDPNCGFRDATEFMNVVFKFGNAHRNGTHKHLVDSDERIQMLSSLRHARNSGGFVNSADGMTETTVDDLGAALLMPESMAPTVLKRDANMPMFRTSARKMDTRVVTQKYRVDHDHRTSVTGGFQVGRKLESCLARSSRAEYRQFQLTAHTMFGAYAASEELIEYSPSTIIDEINEGFESEFASQRLKEILQGTGQGEYTGIWNSKALITIAPSNPNSITVDDISKMEDRWYRGKIRDGAVYLAGNNMRSHLKALQNTTGNKENTNFQYEANKGPDWADGLLNNTPVVFNPDYIPPRGYHGQLGLYDMMQFIEGTWRPMQAASSMHARFDSHERVFKFWTYSAGHVAWDSTLIPGAIPEDVSEADVQANHTLSPFVLLGGNTSKIPGPNRPHGRRKKSA